MPIDQVGGELRFDLEDPDVEQAAVKIQAGFKGMKARKEVSEKRDHCKDERTTEKDRAPEDCPVVVSSVAVGQYYCM